VFTLASLEVQVVVERHVATFGAFQMLRVASDLIFLGLNERLTRLMVGRS